MTTQTLLAEWLEIYEKEHIKSRTYSRYQGLITAHINPMLGEQNIEDLSRRDSKLRRDKLFSSLYTSVWCK